MSLPVVIENERLAMRVWPSLGGKISSLVDKSDRYDLLFNYPDEIPMVPQYDIDYGHSWYAGWDECFPAVARSPYVGHPYDGIFVPDHGELWGLPVTAVPTRDGITTVWHGLRFGYRLTRKLRLEGAALLAEYTLVNEAPFDFRFVWAAHALMNMTMPAKLEMAGGEYRLSHDAAGEDLQRAFGWPRTPDGVDLSDYAGLPGRRGWKLFSMAPISEPATLVYPGREGRRVVISYASEDGVPAYWGIWINTGGWAGHRHIAIEPTTGRYDQIDRAIGDKSAAVIGPSEKVTWGVRWEVG